MKQKFISLALAVMLLLGVTGCAMSTPASVGSIGGVDIPAGIYLLAQYNATTPLPAQQSLPPAKPPAT
mgnify:CR=1 FL=1